MSNRSTFEINTENLGKGLQNIADILQKSRLKISSKSGKTYINIPLIVAVLIAVVFPFTIVLAVILAFLRIANIVIEREVEEQKNKLIEME